jgi:regulator of chromosome condensation
LYSFGRKDYGQLGTTFGVPGAGTLEHTPQPVYLYHSSVAADNSTRVNPKIRSISCGENHSMAVTENGELYTWGFGTNGGLGHGDEEFCFLPKKVKMDKVMEASGGASHTIILLEDRPIVANTDTD